MAQWSLTFKNMDKVPTVQNSYGSIKDATPRQVRKASRKLGFTIPKDELESLVDGLNNGTLNSFRAVDHIPDYLPKVKVPRSPGHFPVGDENPHNAWYVKTDFSYPDKLRTSQKLAGKRVAMKDNICVAGVQMTNGSALLEGFIPECDATVVQRVLEAGGICAGKANCVDLCFSLGCSRGDALNPRNTLYSVGGSSSGCGVLVAAKDVDMAIGGDQGGSIRIPSSWCGVYGLKPTYGLIPYTGCAGIEHSIDSVGPMTNSTRDNAILLEALAGPDGLDHRQGPVNNPPESHFYDEGSPWPIPKNDPKYNFSSDIDEGVRGLKIGIVTEGLANCESVVNQAFQYAVRTFIDFGAIVEEVSIPWHSVGGHIWNAVGTSKGLLDEEFGDGQGNGYRGLYLTSLIDRFSDSRKHHANRVSEPLPRDIFVQAQYIKDTYGNHFYAKGQNLVRKLTFEYDKALREYDILIMPTTIRVAMKRLAVSELSKHEYHSSLVGSLIQNTSPFNISGHPALSIPCGVTTNGLPIGLQLVGKKLGENTLYKASYLFEKAEDWQKLVFSNSRM